MAFLDSSSANRFKFSDRTFADAGGAVSDIFGGIAAGIRAKGYEAEASGLRDAAKLAGDNVELAKVSTGIQEMQARRNELKVIGGQISDVAGAGFESSGTALDLLADSNRQAALEQQIIGVQGAVQENAYLAQETSLLTQAKAADNAAKASGIASIGNFIGGGLKGAAAIATLL